MINYPIVIYEDENVIVVNKPSGMTVNKADTEKGVTVADWVENNFDFLKLEMKDSGEVGSVFWERKGIAHRLDKETSGALIIAKNSTALADLMDQFKRRKIKKEYLALVHGKVEPKEGTVKLPLRRGRKDRRKWQVGADGKQAETSWKVEGYYLAPGNNLGGEVWTLVRLFPKTGRTHQIRVHMSHLGYPLVSDSKYLNPKKVGADRRLLSGHALHAAKISFTLLDGKKVKVEVPMRDDLSMLVDKLIKLNA